MNNNTSNHFVKLPAVDERGLGWKGEKTGKHIKKSPLRSAFKK
jgi:hypothetical protein